MAKVDISALVAKAKGGDTEALGQMYTAFAPKMRKVCIKILRKDSDVVDDLLHDSFILAYTSLGQLRTPEKLESWLCTIVRNVTIRYIENQHARGTQQLTALQEDSPRLHDASQVADARVLANEILSTINELPQGYRTILHLHIFEGYSHQEIGEMLGIAPHSSSSQLARAKQVLWRVMKERKMILAMILAIMALPVYKLFFDKKLPTGGNTENSISSAGKPQVLRKSHAATGESTLASARRAQKREKTPLAGSPTTALPPDSCTVSDTTRLAASDQTPLAQTVQQPDSTIVTAPDSVMPDWHTVPAPHYASSGDVPHANKFHGWHLGGVGLLGATLQQDGAGVLSGNAMAPSGDASSDVGKEDFSNWEDLKNSLEYSDPTNEKTKALLSIASHNSGDIVEHEDHRHPVTLGVSLSKQLTSRWSFSTGLQYSLLRSTFSTGSNGYSIDRHQKLHYLGVPLRLSYRLWTHDNFSAYAGGGITANAPIYGRVKNVYVVNHETMPVGSQRISAPWQFSLSAGAGIQYKFAPMFGLYAEPTFYYHIPNGSSVHSTWTEHPLMFSVPFGIRFTW